jgi:predicted glycoside hydrolase/deacetylase ChbG (UPF0249 family)
MSGEKHLIINADDFGQSPGVSWGIMEAHEHGVVTSASLMVRWPAAEEAATYSRRHPGLSVGLHVDLGEWVYRDGMWVSLYEVVPLENLVEIRGEVKRQLATFRRLVGKDPTHIDSHQHIHLREPLRSILIDTSADLLVPLRHFNSKIRYCGNFYGQTAEGSPLPDAISLVGLTRILSALSEDGVTELSCHPGEQNDLDTMYRSERAQEVKVLCDPRLRSILAGMQITLRSFAGVTNCCADAQAISSSQR